jgi:hypothetical protein
VSKNSRQLMLRRSKKVDTEAAQKRKSGFLEKGEIARLPW